MKCDCKRCDGMGEIECPECDGSGEFDDSIETVRLHKTMKGYEELVELQKDARRVRRQAERLIELNPARSGSYNEQLVATLAVINSQADSEIAKCRKLK